MAAKPDVNELHVNKFPRTRHLFDAGGSVGRDDLLMTTKEANQFLQNTITIEEKVDG